MQKAANLKVNQNYQKSVQAKRFNKQVRQKLEWREQKQNRENFVIFRQNTLKRSEWEQRRKKVKEVELLDLDHLKSAKMEKLTAVRGRLKENERQRLRQQDELQQQRILAVKTQTMSQGKVKQI